MHKTVGTLLKLAEIREEQLRSEMEAYDRLPQEFRDHLKDASWALPATTIEYILSTYPAHRVMRLLKEREQHVKRAGL